MLNKNELNTNLLNQKDMFLVFVYGGNRSLSVV